jgi:hypothetical protein
MSSWIATVSIISVYVTIAVLGVVSGLVALVSNSSVLILRFSGNWHSWFSKSVKANAPTHKPEKLHESMNSSYITQLERKIRDRDNTIKLMERRLTQLEGKQDSS